MGSVNIFLKRGTKFIVEDIDKNIDKDELCLIS